MAVLSNRHDYGSDNFENRDTRVANDLTRNQAAIVATGKWPSRKAINHDLRPRRNTGRGRRSWLEDLKSPVAYCL